jgi:polar amino acid transport system substrate-binding protein
VDVVISQPDIFRASLLKDETDSQKKALMDRVVYADVLAQSTRYWYAFNDPTVRDAFEKGLASIYQSGEIDRILDSYRARYGTSRDLYRELDCRFAKPSARPKCPAGK